MSTDTIQITLPDGATREVPRGTTAAKSRTRFRRAWRRKRWWRAPMANWWICRARWSRTRKFPSSRERSRRAFRLSAFRGASAGRRRARTFPDVKLGIGPPIEYGFFYEFLRDQPFTPEDLERSKKRCTRSPRSDVPNERKLLPKAEALELYRKWDQGFKCELVEEKATEPMVSFYTTGKFIDFCRGPHIPATGRIKAFKLMNVSGAYWKGQEGNPQMQRVYGACFFTQTELDDYLHRLEEAKRRDHRRIGKELELFAVNDLVGAGLAAVAAQGRHGSPPARGIHPRTGARSRLPARLHARLSPKWICTSAPVTGSTTTKTCFRRMDLENEQLVLRPMNCPHHILIYKYKRRSYRELPVRIAELGTMYRYERSGVLSG